MSAKLPLLLLALTTAFVSCRKQDFPNDSALEGESSMVASTPSQSEVTASGGASSANAPTAEPCADAPGFVINPHNGHILDLRGISSGTLMSVQGDVEGEINYFIVPDLPKPNNDEMEPRPIIARPVPGRPGFVFSPFNNQIVDCTDFKPWSLINDPGYAPEELKQFVVPPASSFPLSLEKVE